MTKPEITDQEALEQAKNKRQQRKGRPSKTKPKGSPVMSEAQRSKLFGQPGGNTPGLTSKQKLLAYRAAELAAELSVDILEEVKKRVDQWKREGKSAEAIQELTTNVLALMRDQMDRSYGKAGQTIDLKSTDGSMSPADHSDAVLDALKRKHDPNA